MATRASSVLAAAMIMAAPGTVTAHAIVPDGVANEWVTREPASADSARIVRDRDEPAELVWRDRVGDARGGDDVTQLRAHGNPDGVGFLLRFSGAASPCAQLQIAIDLDRTPGAGAHTFSSEPNTRLRDDARAELFLIATRTGGVVRDGAGVERARFGAGVGADGLELFVPWSAMGLAGWPRGLRMTPVLFCAPDGVTPVAPSDGVTSAAIDALTDYGAPSATVRATRDEVSDGVVNHAFAMHFGVSGAIREGMHIQRVALLASAARGGPWVELVNRSDERISLDRFAIGDEAIPGGGDGLSQLPAGLSVDAGGRVVIALDGAAYRSAFAVGADVELEGTDPMTPDATPLPARGTGSVRFDRAGDELALFDDERTLVDVLTYNGGDYPTIRAYPGLVEDTVITRSPTGLDIDDCALDFYALGAVCGTSADCPDTQCSDCRDRVCAERADGLACSIGGCATGRCFAGACTLRADAGVCASDAGEDARDSGAMAADVASPDVATDATVGDSAVDDVVDARADAVADSAEATALDAARNDGAMDARPDDAAASMDAAMVDDHGATPAPTCACRAPARGASDGRWPLVACVALAAILRRKRARRGN
jgi:hypothetical protein